jgi:hypothetical protein
VQSNGEPAAGKQQDSNPSSTAVKKILGGNKKERLSPLLKSATAQYLLRSMGSVMYRRSR